MKHCRSELLAVIALLLFCGTCIGITMRRSATVQAQGGNIHITFRTGESLWGGSFFADPPTVKLQVELDENRGPMEKRLVEAGITVVRIQQLTLQKDGRYFAIAPPVTPR